MNASKPSSIVPFLVIAGSLAGAAGVAAPALKGASAVPRAPAQAEPVDFSRDIRPTLSAKCFACHGADAESRAAGVRLDLRAEAIRGAAGRRPIVPGNPAASRAFIRITAKNPAQRMPPPSSGHQLSPAEISLVRRWIAQGAPYAEHWAFQKPVRPPLPKVGQAAWVRNPIDAFVLARMEKAGLKPAPEADRYTLIRRVSLDLTGLPPTPEEVEAFVNDRSPNAYEKVVDRLLASPHYGERWAKMWLDLARYADSAGYGSDPLRMNIWPYRDWVIQAFNRNLPYDRFTLEQIAGDLLPNATPDQIAATAFHRNTMTNTEGGTDDEEFRVAAVKDRIATTAQVWMGLTMACAQCHTHKFDPITHREYYQFFAYFNQTEDADRPDEAPTMPVPTASQQEQGDRLRAEIAALEKETTESTPELLAELAAWEREQARPVSWVPLQPQDLRTSSRTHLKSLPDGSILAEGPSPESDTYTLKLRTTLRGISALRLEALPHESLPQSGPGRSPGGNFVLNRVQVSAAPAVARPATARYIRVENTGKERFLSLAEVQVLSGGKNLATGGKATQSSTDFEGPAEKAIDGNTNGEYHTARSTTHTRLEDSPWWEVDLGREAPVDTVTVWNRTDNDTGKRLSNFRVVAYSADRKVVWEKQVAPSPSPSVRLGTSGERSVTLRNATATHSQEGFDVAGLLDTDAKTGWALGGALGKAQAAVFETATPVGDGGDTLLTVTLEQAYGGQHTLGRFRLLATTAAPPVRELPQGIRTVLGVPAAQRTPAQQQELLAFFRPRSSTLAPLFRKIAEKQKALAALKPVALPVLRELPADKRRVTHVMLKGNFLNPGEVVTPALPAAFTPKSFAEDAPGNRLTVARWLISPENPLTARVAVNRFWAQIFGTGIVETEEDFGTQGSLPTHPELLDWLATAFSSTTSVPFTQGSRGQGAREPGDQTVPALAGRKGAEAQGESETRILRTAAASDPRGSNYRVPSGRRNTNYAQKARLTAAASDPRGSGYAKRNTQYALGWDSKALLKLIVTSATYRQSSRVTPEGLQKDPRNTWLSRFPRKRLDAETVRDQALALSGLLSRKIGGPSVYPPQPDGLWRAAFNGQRNWPTSTGEDRYRRGLYTFWRRTVPYPSMATFDAPSREICTVRRLPTNTPLQALVTLNDPAFVEMSQALGRRILREGGATPAERARFALRLALARPPQPEQVRTVVALYEKEREHYRTRTAEAVKLAADPLGPLPEGTDSAEAAAWTVVANVLLNLDGVLSRN